MLLVRGNGDRDVTADPSGGLSPERSAWCARQLDPAAVDRVRAWPLSTTLEVEGLGRVLACHAVPGDDKIGRAHV